MNDHDYKIFSDFIGRCSKIGYIPVSISENDVALLKFSLTDKSDVIFDLLRQKESVIQVSKYVYDSKLRRTILKDICRLSADDYPILANSLSWNDVSFDIYKRIYSLNSDEKINGHFKKMRLDHNSNADEELFNDDKKKFRFRVTINYKKKSRLYQCFSHFCEKPYFVFLLDFVSDFLGGCKLHRNEFFVGRYFQSFNALSNVDFSDGECAIDDKFGFIKEIFDSINVEVFEICNLDTMESKKLKEKFGTIEKALIVKYAMYNRNLINLFISKYGLRVPDSLVFSKK